MKTRMRFFEEPEDKGGTQGAAVFDEKAEGTPPAKEEGTAEGVVDTPAAPATNVVDAAALAKSFGDVLSERFKPVEPTEKTIDKLTPEEAKKLLNVWEPDDEFIKEFGNLETQKGALGKLRDGVIKHMDTISQYRLKELRTALEAKYEPAVKFMEQYQEEQTTNRFHKAYPDLADGKLTPLVKAVAEDLKSKGKRFDDEATLFKVLAEGVESVIKVSNPNFKLSAGSTPAAKPKGQPANAIPVTTPGSGGGTGGKGGDDTAKPRGLAIFDK